MGLVFAIAFGIVLAVLILRALPYCLAFMLILYSLALELLDLMWELLVRVIEYAELTCARVGRRIVNADRQSYLWASLAVFGFLCASPLFLTPAAVFGLVPAVFVMYVLFGVLIFLLRVSR